MEESEHEVAQILLELPNLIAESEPSSECRLKFSAKWRTTGKISAAAAAAGPTPSTACETETEIEKEKRHMALSPTSPFLFPHEITKRQPKIKISFKRKTEQFLKMGDELTESNRIFNEEIKKRKISYDQLKVLNLKLIGAVKESESTSRKQPSQYMAHQQPFIMDQTAHSIGISSQYPQQDRTQNPSNGDKNKVGPFLLPDLNIPLEEDESFLIMESKALAAAKARQRRIQILRSKATNKLPKSQFCR